MKRIALLLCMVAILVAPVRAEPLDAGPYQVVVSTTGPPGLGDNRLGVRVTATARPVDAMVSVHEDMVGMAMSMPPVNLTRTGVGTYEGILSLPMAGQWKLELEIHGPRGLGHTSLTLTAADRPAHATVPPASGPYTARIEVQNPYVGDRPVHVHVVDASGQHASVLQVYLHAAMAGMALQLRPVEATLVGPGDYLATLPLSMVGAWTLTADVEGPAGHTQQTFTQIVRSSAAYTAWLPTVLMGGVAMVWLGILGRRRSWGALALAVGLLAIAVAATWLAGHHTPPDKTMGMTMDMARPDMGMAPSDLSAAVPVAVETVRRGTIFQTVTYTGTVVPRVENTVYPRVQGWLVDVKVYAGDHVHRGEILGRIDDPQLAAQLVVQQAGTESAQARVQLATVQARQAQAGIAMADSEMQAAQTDVVMDQADIAKRAAEARFECLELERDTELLASGVISLKQLQQQQAQNTAAQVDLHHSHDLLRQAEEALQGKRAAWRQAQLAAEAGRQTVDVQTLEVHQARANQAVQQTLSDFTILRARTTGVVTQRLVDPGVLVQPGMPLFKIAAIDQVRLQAAVAEADLLAIHRGTAVRITSPDLRRPIQAHITSVFHSTDPNSHTGTVEALVPNPAGHLLPGSYIVMQIDLQRTDGVLTVHHAALIDGDSTVWKMVERAGQTVATRVPVTTGLDNGQRVAIRQGLSPGDQVIWGGADGLQEGEAVVPAQWGSGPYRDMLEGRP